MTHGLRSKHGTDNFNNWFQPRQFCRGFFHGDMTMTKTKDDHGLNNAKGHFASILEYYEKYETALEADDFDKIDEINEQVQQEALGIAWRCAQWQTVGDRDFQPDEGVVTLTCGGPALQLHVGLQGGEPYDPVLQYQDWFTPWTDLTYGEYGDVKTVDTDEAKAALQWFASQFYWGE